MRPREKRTSSSASETAVASVLLPQHEQLAQKLAHGLACFPGYPRIAADMRIELDARIPVGERRVGIGVDENASFALANMALSRGPRVGRDEAALRPNKTSGGRAVNLD